jgi:hypothetical protein
MANLVRDYYLCRAQDLEIMADEDKRKGDPGSMLRRMGELLAFDYERAARFLRKYCATGHLRYYRAASTILDAGGYNS